MFSAQAEGVEKHKSLICVLTRPATYIAAIHVYKIGITIFTNPTRTT